MDSLITTLYSSADYLHLIAFSLLFLAGFNLPISEDIVMIVSGSIVATVIPERLFIVFASCYLGALSSDIVSYMLGRYPISAVIGSHTIQKHPILGRLISLKRIDKVAMFFKRYGGKTLFFGRFIPFGVRNVLFMTSGIIKLRFLKFLLIDAAALVISSSVMFSLGHAFGENYQELFPYIDKYKFYFLAALIIALTSITVHHFKKKRNQCQLHGIAGKTIVPEPGSGSGE